MRRVEIAKLARLWGVQTSYEGYDKKPRQVPISAVEAVLRTMDATPGGPSPPAAQITTSAGSVDLTGVVELRVEDGGAERIAETLPDDLPLGYHSLIRADGSEQALVLSPGVCHLPPELRQWGWALQLYSLRSRSSWGVGDLGDLRRFAGWSSDGGAGALLLNPLHAVMPIGGQQPSPYYPSSRCFRNPLYLRIEDVPGADQLDNRDELRRAGRALNASDTIDRDAIYALKMDALGSLWNARGVDGFDDWATRRGDLLWTYATYAALAERHDGGPGSWPEELADPHGVAVREWRDQNLDRVRFHAWLQWLLELQLNDASEDLAIINDLAIGVDPQGADAWLWSESFATEMTVGAPPDEFNLRGQNWGLPPFDPWKLRAAGYEPFIQTIRSAFRHTGGIRIDHVMGLFRLFWIPEGSEPAEGTYVRYPYSDLLDLVALESHRAGAYVIGEDLGTVEDLVREEMSARNILSYRLLWFEEDLPEAYPERSLAAVTNHDVPTIAGLWTGKDEEIQESLGQEVNREGTEAQRRRLREWLDLDDDTPLDEVIEKIHSLLAGARSAVVMATLEDALGVVERPNFPGTTEERPNWSIPLPLTLEEIERDDSVARVAQILTARKPARPSRASVTNSGRSLS